jgi:dihydrofolate reductase
MAGQHVPVVAAQMNTLPKVVFSRTLDQASWNNTRLVKGDLVSEIRKLKDESGPGMAIMGSGTERQHYFADFAACGRALDR